MNRGPGLVIVGASLAGLRAAKTARLVGYDGRITLVGEEDHLPYDRPPLSKQALDLDHEPAPDWYAFSGAGSTGFEVATGERAVALDLEARTVRTTKGTRAYDSLIIATGATPRTIPATPPLRGIHVLRTVEDSQAIRAAIAAGARTVVVGAGFIGAEVATAARSQGVDVTLLEASTEPLARAVGAMMGASLSSMHESNGVPLLTGVTVTEFRSAGGHVREVALSNGSALPADLVVVGIGAAPAVEWLVGSGVGLGDGVLCSPALEVLDTAGNLVPDVYAAGDVARWTNPLFGMSMRLENWTSAAEQGALAAHNSLNPNSPTAYATVPYFWSDWYGHRIQFVGVPDADEVCVVSGGHDSDTLIALYRTGQTVTGALTRNEPGLTMKLRNRIKAGDDWRATVDFVAEHLSQRSERSVEVAV